MEIEIRIGREETGPNTITIPGNYKMASRHHAKLLWKDGVVAIEDNESANGTFVNGRRISKTKVKENDVVWLGGEDNEECYQLDMKKVFDSCREAENKARTDYSKEFEELRNVYIEYQNRIAEIKKKTTVKSQMPQRIASFIPTLAGAIIACVPSIPDKARIPVISVGGVITGLINMFMIGKNSSNDALSEQLTDLQIEYQQKYKCPKCGKEIPLTTHWKKLEANGKCPNPKCNAIFVKK